MSEQPTIGIDVIKASLADMPAKPGVYRMMNAAGDILYIGKAKQLKNRVSNYASASGLTYRILRMVNQVAKVEISVTGSEAEALLLESNLIKKYQPKYNILLKDDKSFPSIFIEARHDFPRIQKHRGSQKEEGIYFGPFASVGAVNETLAILQKAFLLRPCSDAVFSNRSRPCLQYQIKRCSAPCVGYIDKQAYGAMIAEAADFMRGKSRDVQERFASQMQSYSENMEFEKAAVMRDRIRALTQIQQEQGMHAAGLDDADILALHHDDNAACVQVYFYRGGNALGSQSYYPSQVADQSAPEIMSAFIGQFYQSRTPANEIFVSHLPEQSELLAEALGMRIDRKVEIKEPKRGAKRERMAQATQNAELTLQQHLNLRMKEKEQLEAIGKLFALDDSPKRIEVYDNSHIMGRYALGAMIVAGPDGFDKKSYRRFNFKDLNLEPGDDYAMMREVFARRFARLQKEDANKSKGNWPDLVLIDGGAGQLSAVSQIFADLGVTDVTYCAIAKGPDRNAGRETFFLPNQQPFTLPPNDPALHYLQRLRDEAHRFAIGSHRVKRAKSLSYSDLDEIPGIGATRKRALMLHFGSKAGVEKATLAELEKVSGINKKVAKVIYDYYHT
jgi:excinuclease ABC subunit C